MKALKHRLVQFAGGSSADTSKITIEIVDARHSIKFVPFNQLVSDNLQEYEDIIRDNPDACFIFISSCEPCNYQAMNSTVSTISASTYIIDSVRKVINAQSYDKCYLWIRDKCLGDNSSDVTYSLMSVYHAIGLCDLVITPIKSTVAPGWSSDIMKFNEFPCDEWNGSTHSLLNHSLVTDSLTLLRTQESIAICNVATHYWRCFWQQIDQSDMR